LPNSDYLEPNDQAFLAQFTTFKNAIGGYATRPGVSAAQVTAQAADADSLEDVLECLNVMRDGPGGRTWCATAARRPRPGQAPCLPDGRDRGRARHRAALLLS
jgi:hypothetical protein